MLLHIILMGVQGAGKGEQAKYIRDEHDIPHISTGDLFRGMRNRDDDLARRIQDTMKQGKLVSNQETNEVLLDRLSQGDTSRGFILDGYPRNVSQAQWLDGYLEEQKKQLSAVILLELDLYVAFKRSFGRLSSAKSGKTYNIYFHREGIKYGFIDYPHASFFPPRLEALEIDTGEPLVRRPDDAHAGAIVRRIDDFVAETQPLIAYYENIGILYRIDASQSIDEVRLAIMLVIDEVSKRP